MLQAARPRFARSDPHRRRRTAIGLSALLLAMLPVWLPSHAVAQTLPAAISDAPRDVRFILMAPNGANRT
jgi:hypothetical protein